VGGMNVDLSAADLILCAHEAERRWINKLARGNKATKLIYGEKGNAADEYDVIYSGMLVEYAVCHVLGVPMDTRLLVGGDGGVDLNYKGYSLQVKLNRNTGNDRYLIFNSLDDFCTDLAILGGLEKPTRVRIDGCISRATFRRDHKEKNFGYGVRKVFPESGLLPIDKIMDLQERKAA
jgi:hypothetical protein